MIKTSLDYKLCELSTKIKLMDKERINFRKEYLETIHPEDLNHLLNHIQEVQLPDNHAKLSSEDNDCGLIEL